MIRIINYLAGTMTAIVARLALTIYPSLKEQFILVKGKVIDSARNRKEMPEPLLAPLIETEDRRFFYHRGVDLYSIIRAIKNINIKRLEGASTIPQQLIRGITNKREISVRRKIKEIMLASLISMEFTKDEILTAYLNTYDFGKCTGIKELCSKEGYDIHNLSVSDLAQLVARFKYPVLSRYNYIKYLRRVRIIENKILKHKEITARNSYGDGRQFERERLSEGFITIPEMTANEPFYKKTQTRTS